MTPLVERPGALWLDTGTPEGTAAGTSYVAAEPALWLRGRGDTLEILPGPLGDRGWGARVAAMDPGVGEAFDRLKAIARGLTTPMLQAVGEARFPGGLAGFFSYDLGRRFEEVPATIAPHSADVPWDFVLGLYDEVLSLDGRTGVRRVHRLPGSARRLERHTPLLPSRLPDVPGAAVLPQPEMTRAEHAEAVRSIREHISAGTIYQANLTLRFRAPSTHPRAPLATFLRLQASNPAPFAAYLDLPGMAVVSTSPECFLSLSADRRALSRPIKGTAPRGADPVSDASFRQGLLASFKDRAELTMIVDLVRNDLGRVCALGTVSRAPELRCEAHPTVWHLVADVQGRLRDGVDGLDLLRASFPPGSCIGAPKIRAMAIIEELERSRRGPYTGAIGWVSADGGLGLSVAIRTLVFREGEVSYGVGGGIVYDSDPDREWEEALLKGRALANALASSSLPLTSHARAGN
ncbi:MAG: anthranilate synthase component I family protein [Deltaproteobacteria bacterium]|nr:anthranilate synthase component I family protein [Deltaproteobacteria bacterium]